MVELLLSSNCTHHRGGGGGQMLQGANQQLLLLSLCHSYLVKLRRRILKCILNLFSSQDKFMSSSCLELLYLPFYVHHEKQLTEYEVVSF